MRQPELFKFLLLPRLLSEIVGPEVQIQTVPDIRRFVRSKAKWTLKFSILFGH